MISQETISELDKDNAVLTEREKRHLSQIDDSMQVGNPYYSSSSSNYTMQKRTKSVHLAPVCMCMCMHVIPMYHCNVPQAHAAYENLLENQQRDIVLLERDLKRWKLEHKECMEQVKCYMS